MGDEEKGMVTSCEKCPLRGLNAFQPFDADDVAFMLRFKVGELRVDASTPILMEGSNAPQLYTVLRGMGVRYKLLPSGDRQVVNFVFPGDFIGLQAGVMGEMGHSVEATTAMTLCVFDRKNIWQLFRERPERAYDLTWIAAVEEHFLGETLLTLGRRDAVTSTAWALLKTAERGLQLGFMRNGRMPFPFRQQDLADALGQSLVHTNKTLRRLRDRQLATWRDRTLFVPDLDALAAVAETDRSKARPRPLI